MCRQYQALSLGSSRVSVDLIDGGQATQRFIPCLADTARGDIVILSSGPVLPFHQFLHIYAYMYALLTSFAAPPPPPPSRARAPSRSSTRAPTRRLPRLMPLLSPPPRSRPRTRNRRLPFTLLPRPPPPPPPIPCRGSHRPPHTPTQTARTQTTPLPSHSCTRSMTHRRCMSRRRCSSCGSGTPHPRPRASASASRCSWARCRGRSSTQGRRS
ncbi:hypothetical protein C8R46DRAFT_183023 [Mycena filopes]|nr:hypothetical protein C8R46DRAFT_183023 [Mycena filopes]